MDSIGNDIVALEAVNVDRTVTPNFYNKILAGSELPLHQSNCPGIPFYQFVWLAWSLKEAAYKCFKRIQPNLVFSPTKTVVTAIAPPTVLTDKIPTDIHQTGIDDAVYYQIEVSINSQTLYARSVIFGDELVHTIASFTPDFSDVRWGLKKILATDPDSQTAAVRAFLTTRVQTDIVKDDNGIPSLNIAGGQLPVSLSHHGEWVGYAF